MHTILGLSGSLRRGSWNRRLLEAAVRLAPPTMEITLYPTLAHVPFFNEDEEQAETGRHGPVADLRHAVREADGVLIATPEYNQSMPGVLKNAIDWLSRPGAGAGLEGKPVAIVGATTGPWGTRLSQHAVRQTLAATGAAVLPAPMLFVRDAAALFDGTGQLVDVRTQQSLQRVLAALELWVVGARHDPNDRLSAAGPEPEAGASRRGTRGSLARSTAAAPTGKHRGR